jgi:CheY-like chemotaxis protein
MPVASSLSVLIVDDQQTIRSLVRSGLQQLGFSSFAEAPDGEEGLRQVLVKPVQLVISDFNMPKLDGLGLLRASLAAVELNDLVGLASQLEATVVGLIARLDGGDPQTLIDCQVLDLLTQRLAGVSCFVAGLAAETPIDVWVDATQAMQGLTLTAQSLRLSDRLALTDPQLSSGEAAFFTD